MPRGQPLQGHGTGLGRALSWCSWRRRMVPHRWSAKLLVAVRPPRLLPRGNDREGDRPRRPRECAKSATACQCGTRQGRLLRFGAAGGRRESAPTCPHRTTRARRMIHPAPPVCRSRGVVPVGTAPGHTVTDNVILEGRARGTSRLHGAQAHRTVKERHFMAEPSYRHRHWRSWQHRLRPPVPYCFRPFGLDVPVKLNSALRSPGCHTPRAPPWSSTTGYAVPDPGRR